MGLLHLPQTAFAAEEEQELWVQLRSLTSALGPFDYDQAQNQLLTTHGRSALLWDASTGLALREYVVERNISHLRLMSDQRLLIGTNRSASIFNKQSGELLQEIQLGDINDHHFLLFPNEGQILVLTCNQSQMRLWDLLSGETQQIFQAEGKVKTATISPNNKYLLTVAEDSVGILWEVKNGNVYQRFIGPTNPYQLAFDSTGQHFLMTGAGEFWYTPCVTVWRTHTAEPILSIPRVVATAKFNGQAVHLFYPDGQTELWPLDRVEEPPPRDEWPQYRYHPKDRWYFSGNNHRLHVQESPHKVTLLTAGTTPQTIAIPTEPTTLGVAYHRPLDLSRSGRWLLTGCSDWKSDQCSAALWDLEEGKLQRFFHPFRPVLMGRFSPDETTYFVGHGKELRQFDIESGQVLQAFQIKQEDSYAEGLFTSIAIADDGQYLLTSTGDWYNGDGGAVLLWDIESGSVERNFVKSGKAVLFAGSNKDESKIVIARSPGDDGSSGLDELSLIDRQSGEIIKTEPLKDGWYHAGDSNPNREAVPIVQYHSSSSGKDKTSVVRWSTETLTPLGEPLNGQGPIHSSSADLLTMVTEGPRIRLHDSTGKNLIYERETKIADGHSARFHPTHPLLIGAKSTYRDQHGHGVVIEDVVTGDVRAELLLFQDSNDWLIIRGNGTVHGSPAGLKRVTWRKPGTLAVSRELKASQQSSGGTLLGLSDDSLPDEVSLKERLLTTPQPELSPLPEPTPERREWYDWSMDRREKIAADIEARGGQVRANIHKSITFVHLEGKAISKDLLKELRFAGAIDRLYLANTGITNQQLDYISVLPYLKRLSLWNNPISDQGLRELEYLKQLEVLDVHNTEVTASGLNRLSKLPVLKTLIYPARIDENDLQPLKKAHPEIQLVPRVIGSGPESK